MKLGFGKGNEQINKDETSEALVNGAGEAAISAADASNNGVIHASSDSGENAVDLTKLKKKDLLEIMLKQGEEIDALKSEIEDLRSQLESKEFQLSKVGSIAEASLAVTEIFKEADKAAMIYLANLRRIAEEGMKK